VTFWRNLDANWRVSGIVTLERRRKIPYKTEKVGKEKRQYIRRITEKRTKVKKNESLV
jgi:hypothetical protein